MFQDIIRPTLKEVGKPLAQMATMHVWHPDILDFIKAKREDGKFRQFNLSVLITNDFMKAVKEGDEWELYFPIHEKEYNSKSSKEIVWVNDFPFESSDYIYHSDTSMVACKVYKTIPARELWDIIMESNYNFAEPGLLFIDRINEFNPLNANEVIVATNPCGEQPLPPYGSCLLGSILLTKFVVNPFEPPQPVKGSIASNEYNGAYFDWGKFKEVTRFFVRMLDNVVELNGLALPEQRVEIVSKRRHGMGFLGLGSALAMLGIPYGSSEAIAFTEEVSKVIAVVNMEEGVKLAKEKGAAPIFVSGQHLTGSFLRWYNHPFTQKVLAECGKETQYLLDKYGCRFTHATSIAPTGTLSFAIGNNCSNGIEPTFAHEYKRNVIKEGQNTKQQMTVYSAEALAWLEKYGNTDKSNTRCPYKDQWLVSKSSDNGRTINKLYFDSPEEAVEFCKVSTTNGYTFIPKEDYFSTTDDITPEQHIAMQAAAQKWVDSSISKTINVPTDISMEEFSDIYMNAYDSGLKGCTTFRFNPEAFSGVLVRDSDLKETFYEFTLDSGEKVVLAGDETVWYEDAEHNAANLFDALKEGYYGKF
jgi:ribonucleoside-diphosphate reductase alpha chain